jgi:hypothetical protein
VFAHRRPIGFFGSYGEAFGYGLALFGVNQGRSDGSPALR